MDKNAKKRSAESSHPEEHAKRRSTSPIGYTQATGQIGDEQDLGGHHRSAPCYGPWACNCLGCDETFWGRDLLRRHKEQHTEQVSEQVSAALILTSWSDSFNSSPNDSSSSYADPIPSLVDCANMAANSPQSPRSNQAQNSLTRSFTDSQSCAEPSPPTSNKCWERGNSQELEDNGHRERLACPFFKRNPRAHSGTPCRYPGFTGIHRMKEHLYRVHILVNCNRCHRVFKTETELREHQRETIPCIVSNLDRPEGIDTTQLARLKSKKKFGQERTEEEKWRAIYHFLFPNEDANSVSPYCDDLANAQEQALVPLIDYEIFCRSEYSRKIRLELDSFCNQLPHPIEDRLRTEIVNIAQRVRDTLYRDFQRQMQASSSRSKILAHRTNDTTITSPLSELTLPPSLDFVSKSGMDTASLSKLIHAPTNPRQQPPLPSQSSINLFEGAVPFKTSDMTLFPTLAFARPQASQDNHTSSWAEQCNEIGDHVLDDSWVQQLQILEEYTNT